MAGRVIDVKASNTVTLKQWVTLHSNKFHISNDPHDMTFDFQFEIVTLFKELEMNTWLVEPTKLCEMPLVS